LLHAEEFNIPNVLKELAIVLTPGVLLAFIFCIADLYRRRQHYAIEWQFSVVATVGTVSLVVAYSMLVFDERYLFPIFPLMLAIAVRYLVKDPLSGKGTARKISIALVVTGMCASLTYPASPFRYLKRDYQAASYQAGTILRSHPGPIRLVSIGSGSFPEHGVGWEAGYQAAYFGGKTLIATEASLPDWTKLNLLESDIAKAHPDAIVVWGRPDNVRYVGLMHALTQYNPNAPEKIIDHVLGEVGSVIFCKTNSFQS
jgi:hypothetical protein